VFTEVISEENTESDNNKLKIISFSNNDDISGTSSAQKESLGLPVTPVLGGNVGPFPDYPKVKE
jgi:hypothetical protein